MNDAGVAKMALEHINAAFLLLLLVKVALDQLLPSSPPPLPSWSTVYLDHTAYLCSAAILAGIVLPTERIPHFTTIIGS